MTHKDLKSTIMKDIESGKVHIRSKNLVIAEKLGLGSAFALTTILAILFICLTFLYFKTTDNLDYLSFGNSGLLAFFESFPYILVLTVTLLIILAGYLTTKSDISYKKPFAYIVIGLIGFVLFTGTLIAYSGVGTALQNQAHKENIIGTALKPFFDRALNKHKSGIAGRVIEIHKDILFLQTPRGIEIINIESCESCHKLSLTQGDAIIGVGTRREKHFEAHDIRILKNEEIQMILHGVKKKFGPQKPGTNRIRSSSNTPTFDQPIKLCLQKCLDQNRFIDACRQECNAY